MPSELRTFAESYTAAWCSQDAASVAAHYTPVGSLRVNDGPPALGRAAIAAVAESFMTAFPDMRVALDRLVIEDGRLEYHWILTGTHTGPGGTGNKVHIIGYETWRLTGGLISDSQGHFDADDYQRQLSRSQPA